MKFILKVFDEIQKTINIQNLGIYILYQDMRIEYTSPYVIRDSV